MCKPTHAYDKYIKELDSLKVVVEQAVDNFNTVDSIMCYNAYSKHYTYSTFINTHLNDTVTKEQAEALQSFFATGKPLNDYLAMRPLWLTEARLRIKQVSALTVDLKNGSVETGEAVEFINEEKKQSEKIIEELKINTALIRKQLEAYTKNLPVVEGVLRSINLNTLPELIKPELNKR